MEMASILSAIAGTIAACLAGASLYASGQREEARWVREVLLQALETYLDASFRVTTAARRIQKSAAGDDIDNLKEQVEANHALQLQVLTRLRLIASKEVVEAAAAIHQQDHRFVARMMGEDPVSLEEYQIALAEVNEKRNRYLDLARGQLRIKGSIAEVDHVALRGASV
jgi:hypothetical protein